MGKGLYSYNTKEWQPLVGCRNDLPCVSRCWAHRTVRRTVKCLERDHPERAEFFRQFVTDKAWTGRVAIDEAHLLDPLKWRKPQVVATGYHGDWGLLPPEALDRIFAVSALCPQHQILFLTKRPERLVEYFTRLQEVADGYLDNLCKTEPHKKHSFTPSDVLNLRWMHGTFGRGPAFPYGPWPLPNVWLGTSISDQPSADERMEHLRKLAMAGWNTWISLEPMISEVSFRWAKWEPLKGSGGTSNHLDGLRWLKWVVVGGESGKNARPFDIAWARSVRDQCAAAGVAFYMKQLGRYPVHNHGNASFGSGLSWIKFRDRSGSDPADWPADLRVQQTPWEVTRCRY